MRRISLSSPQADVRSIRSIRVTARAPRMLAMATCVVLVAVGLRSLVGPDDVERQQRAPGTYEPSAATFAEAFARTYMTFDPSRPEERARALAAFAPAAAADLDVGGRRNMRVGWSAVAAEERFGSRRDIVTVVLETSEGLRHLAVDVRRAADGGLRIAGPPALVGPPIVASDDALPAPREVDDDQLESVAGRVVRNYLARELDDLAADLDATARVSLPDSALRVTSIDAVSWVRTPQRVAVTATAEAGDGTRLVLRYQLTVVHRAGRWLVRFVHVNPAAREAAP